MGLRVKGHGEEIELCFDENTSLEEAIREVQAYANEANDFFKKADINISYSGLNINYNGEIRFSKALRKFFGNKVSLVKKHCLSYEQIAYSLKKDETVCLVINKSLRSGEKVSSRGDVVVYGDVNPGAVISAEGNINVIGKLRGEAQVNKTGKVFALQMQPTQIRIGKIISYNKNNENVGTAVALMQNGEIILQCL